MVERHALSYIVLCSRWRCCQAWQGQVVTGTAMGLCRVWRGTALSKNIYILNSQQYNKVINNTVMGAVI